MHILLDTSASPHIISVIWRVIHCYMIVIILFLYCFESEDNYNQQI